MAKIPDKIDKYPIEALVATGGMGAVYRGVHPTLERSVIIKKLTLRGDKSLAERFRREARILMDFRHDHIVDVFDHFTQGRSNYIVMEYVDGLSVKELLEQERYLDGAVAARILLYTARALAYAHRKGVIHRDIKPANILLSRDGDVKLADFGIASNPDAGDDTLTADGATLGTPAYMAPEQFENSRTVDARADVYSLGVMLYEMLTGQKPFPGGFSPEVIQAIQKGRYRKPRRLNPSVPRDLQRLVVLMMRPRRARRPADLSGIITRLERYLERFHEQDIALRLAALVRGEEPTLLRRRARRRPGLKAVGIAATLIIIGVLGWLFAVTGLHLRLLRPASYGQIRLEAPGMSSARVSLYADDRRDIPAVERNLLLYRMEKQLQSLPLVLPAGHYRLKAVSGERVVWASFRLRSWSRSPGSLVVRIPAPDYAEEAIRVRGDVRDGISGLPLDSPLISVLNGGGFVPIAEAGPLYSGRIYHFRVSAAGYLYQDFVLRIDAGQNDLEIRAELIPLPGSLRLTFPPGEPDFVLRIDERSTVDVVENALVSRVPLDIALRREYALLPGEYRIRVSGDQWSAESLIRIGSGMVTELVIDPLEGRLELR
jgi:hypothetical protein